MKREFKDLISYEPYEYLNSEITGGYDEVHAVKCVNGIFVGTEEHGVASWLGIPYAKPRRARLKHCSSTPAARPWTTSWH